MCFFRISVSISVSLKIGAIPFDIQSKTKRWHLSLDRRFNNVLYENKDRCSFLSLFFSRLYPITLMQRHYHAHGSHRTVKEHGESSDCRTHKHDHHNKKCEEERCCADDSVIVVIPPAPAPTTPIVCPCPPVYQSYLVHNTAFVNPSNTTIGGGKVGDATKPFRTVQSALAAILALKPTADDSYVVRITPGVFRERWTIPDYTRVIGSGQNQTLLIEDAPSTDGSPMVAMSQGSAIEYCGIKCKGSTAIHDDATSVENTTTSAQACTDTLCVMGASVRIASVKLMLTASLPDNIDYQAIGLGSLPFAVDQLQVDASLDVGSSFLGASDVDVDESIFSINGGATGTISNSTLTVDTASLAANTQMIRIGSNATADVSGHALTLTASSAKAGTLSFSTAYGKGSNTAAATTSSGAQRALVPSSASTMPVATPSTVRWGRQIAKNAHYLFPPSTIEFFNLATMKTQSGGNPIMTLHYFNGAGKALNSTRFIPLQTYGCLDQQAFASDQEPPTNATTMIVSVRGVFAEASDQTISSQKIGIASATVTNSTLLSVLLTAYAETVNLPTGEMGIQYSLVVSPRLSDAACPVLIGGPPYYSHYPMLDINVLTSQVPMPHLNFYVFYFTPFGVEVDTSNPIILTASSSSILSTVSVNVPQYLDLRVVQIALGLGTTVNAARTNLTNFMGIVSNGNAGVTAQFVYYPNSALLSAFAPLDRLASSAEKSLAVVPLTSLGRQYATKLPTPQTPPKTIGVLVPHNLIPHGEVVTSIQVLASDIHNGRITINATQFLTTSAGVFASISLPPQNLNIVNAKVTFANGRVLPTTLPILPIFGLDVTRGYFTFIPNGMSLSYQLTLTTIPSRPLPLSASPAGVTVDAAAAAAAAAAAKKQPVTLEISGVSVSVSRWSEIATSQRDHRAERLAR